MACSLLLDAFWWLKLPWNIILGILFTHRSDLNHSAEALTQSYQQDFTQAPFQILFSLDLAL